MILIISFYLVAAGGCGGVCLIVNLFVMIVYCCVCSVLILVDNTCLLIVLLFGVWLIVVG